MITKAEIAGTIYYLLDVFLVLYRVEHVNVIFFHVIKEQTIQLMYKTSNIQITSKHLCGMFQIHCKIQPLVWQLS